MSEKLYEGHYEDEQACEIAGSSLMPHISTDTIIVCIGTDRVTGDALGPLVGMLLKEKGIPNPIYGTIEKPVHALNLENTVKEIESRYPEREILAIDASIGVPELHRIGKISIDTKGIQPGRGVGKQLGEMGDYSIQVVTMNDELQLFFSRQSARLYDVMNMAKVVANAVEIAINGGKVEVM